MSIQEAIKKSIEGGYYRFINGKGADNKTLRQLVSVQYDMNEATGEIEKQLLDPLFWQCLGKSLGWGAIGNESILTPEWKIYWHRFIDYLAEGKSAEEFFKEL